MEKLYWWPLATREQVTGKASLRVLEPKAKNRGKRNARVRGEPDALACALEIVCKQRHPLGHADVMIAQHAPMHQTPH